MTTQLHYDSFLNHYVQLHGTKRFKLVRVLSICVVLFNFSSFFFFMPLAAADVCGLCYPFFIFLLSLVKVWVAFAKKPCVLQNKSSILRYLRVSILFFICISYVFMIFSAFTLSLSLSLPRPLLVRPLQRPTPTCTCTQPCTPMHNSPKYMLRTRREPSATEQTTPVPSQNVKPLHVLVLLLLLLQIKRALPAS